MSDSRATIDWRQLREFAAVDLSRSFVLSWHMEFDTLVVDLINGMAAFETYSHECENRNSEDAQIHAYLGATASRSRAMLEAALARVAEFEGIDIN